MRFNFEEILKKEPKFRSQQIKRAVFRGLIENWDEAQVLPKELRERLREEAPLDIEAKIFVFDDEQTIKVLITLEDGFKIETVLMRYKDRNTVCVSSQVGCSLKCSFCATGKLGFQRNLNSDEIVSQVLFFSRYLKKDGQRVSNVVFMGMGEPFLNYENVVKAVRILNDKDGLNIGIRKISISTAGITEGIKKLAQENIDVNLAISLHAPNDELRKKLMPIAEKYSINEVLKSVNDYIGLSNRKVMFEYIMIRDVNDSNGRAEELAKLMKHKLYMVNLISYNPTGIFNISSAERIKKFREILEERGIEVTQRYKFGKGIKGACGQLAGR